MYLLGLAADDERDSTVPERFSRAMILQAVQDLRGELRACDRPIAPQLRRRARQWLRGEVDDRLANPCRAAVCFENLGISHPAALEALGIEKKKKHLQPIDFQGRK